MQTYRLLVVSATLMTSLCMSQVIWCSEGEKGLLPALPGIPALPVPSLPVPALPALPGIPGLPVGNPTIPSLSDVISTLPVVSTLPALPALPTGLAGVVTLLENSVNYVVSFLMNFQSSQPEAFKVLALVAQGQEQSDVAFQKIKQALIAFHLLNADGSINPLVKQIVLGLVN